MSRKPLGILLTLLESTLAGVLVSVDSKGLTDILTPLDATLTKNPGGRGGLLASSFLLPSLCAALRTLALDQELEPMGGRKAGH